MNNDPYATPPQQKLTPKSDYDKDKAKTKASGDKQEQKRREQQDAVVR